MKKQWTLILALIFALIIAIFSVVNVDPVRISYLFGEAFVPLIIVILGSALSGGIIVGAVGIFRYLSLHLEIRQLKKKVSELEAELKTDLKTEEVRVADTSSPLQLAETNNKSLESVHLENNDLPEKKEE